MLIRQTICASLLLFVLGVGQSLAALNSEPALPALLTARDAVRFALSHNPDTTIGQQRLIAAQAAIDLERATMVPQVSLSSQYSQTNAPMYSFGNILNQGEFSNSINFNDPGRTDSLKTGVQLGYRLFNGGRDQAMVEAAQGEASASQMELAAIHARLAFEVMRAFYGIKQATEIIDVNQSTVKALSSSLKMAQARHEEGVLLMDAVLDLEVQLSRARENLIQAQHAKALARKIFLALLGVEEGVFEIVPESGDIQEVPLSAVANPRFELKVLDEKIEAAQARVRQAQAGSFPVVDGFAGYSLDQGFVTDGSDHSWQAGVVLKYALFDGDKTSSELIRAMATVAELRGKRRKLELAIGLEVQQARNTLRESEERLQVTEKTIAQARKSAEINRARFAEGMVLPSDLIAVEKRLSDALIRRTMAKTSRLIAIAELRRASGLPQFDDLPEISTAKEPEQQQ